MHLFLKKIAPKWFSDPSLYQINNKIDALEDNLKIAYFFDL